MLHRKVPLPFWLIGCALILTVGCNPAEKKQPPAPEPFPLEIDHLFVWVAKEAPEAKALEAAGLKILEEVSKHTGQGTASRGCIFENSYLELIWIDDEKAASDNSSRSGIDFVTRARWKESGASPFGIGLHRVAGRTGVIPFPVIDYWAEWMEPKTSIQFSRDVSDPKEPMYFVVPDSMAIPDAATLENLRKADPGYAAMLVHPLGVKKLTGIRVVTNGNGLIPTASALSEGGVLRVEKGDAGLMELTFDGGAEKQTIDLRPQLPLILRY